jgi:dihydrofolate synthase/folylpolyglutamate synthase
VTLGWQEIWAAIDARARFGVKPGLERIERLLERLGQPQRGLRCVQVAGTNGKGGAAFALASLLTARGRPCGLYVSPHLLHPSERIRLDGAPLDEAAAAAAWAELEPLLEEVEPSYFETLTALALLAFRRGGMEWAVLECGLGGRWDATSVVQPELALLTSVGADHLAVLGPTLADVARDKAHVAPRGGLLLSAVCEPELAAVVEETAASRGARVRPVPPTGVLRESLIDGRAALHHAAAGVSLLLPEDTRSWREAAALALEALALLDLPRPTAETLVPLEAAQWPGRFQVLSLEPPRVLDVAHNPPALARLAQELAARWPGRRFNALLAGMADKDLAGNLAALRPVLAECRALLAPGHARAAGRRDWERAAREAGLHAPAFVSRAGVDELRAAVSTGDVSRDAWAGEALLVGGSFLAAAAWLGATELPPGL